MLTKFVPRTAFTAMEGLPRSNFPGHHQTAIEKMKSMLDNIDHIIECRDYRIPATSINPVLEKLMQQKKRTVVYTKRDLGGKMTTYKARQVWFAVQFQMLFYICFIIIIITVTDIVGFL